MRNLLLLTKKNLKLLIRAKGSALIIIFAPLLLMLILGLSYNTTSQYDLNIGIHAPSFSEDVNEFIKILEEEQFTIIKYEESVDPCISDIKSGAVHTCISLPESLAVDGNQQKEVTFHIDQSRINIVWMIQETVKQKFNLQSQQITQDLTQNILGTLDNTKTTIAAKKAEINVAKEKTTAASGSASSAKSSLSNLDLTTTASNHSESAVTDLDTDLKKSLSLVKDAKTAVSGAGLDETKEDEIKAILNDAENKLDSVIDGLNSNSSSGVGGIISALNTELTATKSKLNAASAAVASSNSNLDSVTAALQESQKNLDSAASALASLESEIGNVKVTDASTITAPLVTKIEKVSEESTYLNYLFSALLVLVIMFSSLLLGTSLVMMEKNSPAFLRNFFLPIRKITFISSVYLTNLILNIIQILIILGISLIFLKGAVYKIPSVALILLITASVFTFMGMVIGYLFRSEETGVLASISLGSFHLLFSGIILPLESVTLALRKIAYFNPFVLADKLVREVFLFNAPLTAVWVDLATLVGYALIFFIIILIIESILHEHIVHRFMKHHHRAHRQKDKKKKNDG